MEPDLELVPKRKVLSLDIEGPPVSQQARGLKREAYALKLRSAAGGVLFRVVGDVQLFVEWFVDERDRYESDEHPDVDNILKPLLDALSGPQGILIDDCQVQALDCRWIDTLQPQRHRIQMSYDVDDAWPRDAVAFVQLDNGICYPYQLGTPADALHALIAQLQYMRAAQSRLENLGVARAQAASVIPVQRAFHRSRIRGFDVTRVEELLNHNKP